MKRIISLLLLILLTQITFSANLIGENGEKIDMSKSHMRIISLYGAHTEVLVGIGAQDNLIGIDKNSEKLGLNTPVFSYKDNVEKFIAAKPDLILIRPMIRDRFKGLVSGLVRAGIDVVTIQPTKFDELDDYWLTLGKLSGHEKNAEKYVADFHNDLNKLVKIANTIPKNERKTAYFESIHKSQRTTSQGGMPATIFGLLNINNIAYDAVPTKKGSAVAHFEKEKLISRGNEVEVYIAQYGAMNKPTIEMIKKAPGYGAIKAIRDGEVYIVSEDVSRPTNGLIEGITTIGKIVYPNYFK